MTPDRSPIGRLIPIALLLASVFLGCATIPVPTRSQWADTDGPARHCADLLSALDQRVSSAQAIDPGAFRVEGFPYLRLDRFLASFRDEIDDEDAFAAWVAHMQALDQEARRHEIANLPDAGPPEARADLYEQVVACGNRLKAIDFSDEDRRRLLRQRATAPDDYILMRQILGIYPAVRWFLAMQVARWQTEVHRTFSVNPPEEWSSMRYVPAAGKPDVSMNAIVRGAERDALGVPHYTATALESLFDYHAPIWEIDTRGDHDRIGAPFWTPGGALAVDTGQPVTYTLLSHTRFQGQVLTQLNYLVWFPSRPKVNPLDIYGGLLDGLNYRVTLDQDGEPLLYDTVHHCGCYYAAYPTRRLAARENIAYKEPPLILEAPDPHHDHQRMTLGMRSRTHFVRHLYGSEVGAHDDAVAYRLSPYSRLRSLDDGRGGRRSMFDPDSLAPGTQRLERLLLWPTGVYSAGGMRQWGRHAVGFAGRRHFDDPFFMEEMFTPE
jgi:hypothetical protein